MIRMETARTLTWQTPLPTVNPISEFAHSYAVTVGIDGYGQGIPPLRTAANDARLLAALLQEQHGYYVACMTETVTLSALETFFTRRLPDQVGKEDRLLIHFAGHGVALDGDDGPRGYLLPEDAQADDSGSFLSMQTFRAWLDRLPCRHLLLILDCCFAGAFRWSGTRDTRRMRDTLPAERYHHYLTSRSWQVVTSAAHNERAYDQLVYHNILGQRGETLYDGKPHSPFALALFEGLAGGADLWPRGQGDGVITAGELQVHLSQQVASVTHNAQTPQLWPLPQHDRGEYLFLTPGRIPSLPAAKPLDAENSPWRGLQPYRAADAEIFYGRDALAAKLTQLVVEQANPLVVVVGGSGTGKSSLVQAGLIPRLRQMYTPEGMAIWRVLATVRPGSEPVQTMVQQVQGALADEETPPEDEGEACHWCADRIRAWLEEHPERRMLLVIDQFEEIVTFCRDEAERKRFLTLLGWLLAQQFARLQIIITLRSDFEPHFRDLPFSDLWRQGRFVVRSLSSEELHDIVEGPAEVREIYFESAGLVSSIVDEVAQTPGALPLLSFTLHELYLRYLQRQAAARHRDQIIERCLTEEDYVDLGGVVGALGRRASDLCARLTPDEQASMQRIMLRMVATEGGELARRRVAQWELDFDPPAEAARVKAVIEKLVAARLVVEDLDPVANEEYVEPAHDALIRAWDRILQWRDEAGDLLPLQRRLTRAARDWMRAAPEQRSRLLWTNNARLPQVHQMLAPRDYPSSEEEAVMPAGDRARLLRRLFNPTIARPRVPTPLNRVETDFVLLSIQKRAALLRRIALAVTATFIVLAALAGAATWQWRAAIRNRTAELAETSLREAESALDLLAAKPFESLKLALGAMPREGTLETRPYVPQAEFALGQALRVNQEFTRVDTGATKPAQMAVTPTRIVVGDGMLRLFDHNLVARATFDVGTTGPIEAVIAAPDGRIIAYSKNFILIVRDDRLLHAQQFDESVQIACATWRPDADDFLLCLGQPGNMALWRWSPRQGPQNELQQIVTNLDPYGPTARHGAHWSPDGARLAVWGGNLMVWEPEDGRLRIFPESRGQDGATYVQFAAWSADSRALVSAWDGDSKAYLWSLTDPEAVQPIEIGSSLLGGHALTAGATDEMSMALWTRDARAVTLDIGLSADNATAVRPIRYVEQRPFDLPGAIGPVRDVVPADATGAAVAAPAAALMDSGQVFLWRPVAGAQACSGQHDAAVMAAAWRGNYFATAGGDGVVRIWQSAGDSDTPCMTLTKLPRQSRAVVALAWLDAARLLTLSEADPDEADPGTLRIWSIFDEHGRPVCRQAGADDGLECLTYSAPVPNSPAQGDIASVRWLDYETVLVEEVVEDGVTWRSWQVQKNGRLREVPDGRHRWPFPIPETAQPAWNPTGTRVLLYGWESGGVIQRWERGQWEEQTLFREPVVNAQWLKAGSFWQVDTGQGYYLSKDNRLYEIPGMPVAVSEVADMVLAVLDDQDAVSVWSLQEEDEPKLLFTVTESALLQELESRLKPELSRIHAIDASADGRYLAATVETGDLVIWDLAKQGKMMSWAYPTEEVASLPFAWHPQLPALVTAQSGEIFVLTVKDKPIRTSDDDPTEVVDGSPIRTGEDGRIGAIRSGPIAGDIRHVAWYGEPDRILVQDGHYARLWQWEPKEGLLHEIMRVPHTASSHPLLNRGGDRLITRDDTWGWRIWEAWPSYERLVAEAERVVQQRAYAE